MTELLKAVESLSLAEALELRKTLDHHLARLALKTIDVAVLEELDGSDQLADADSLQGKAEML